MPRLSLASIALLLLAAPVAADEGLYLSWGDCALGTSSSVQTFPCDTEGGEHALVCALTMPQRADSVLGLEIVVDVQHAASTLPDWWHLEPVGCRDGALKVDQVFGAACRNVWIGQASGGLLDYVVGMPRGGANQTRITIGFSVPSTQPRILEASEMYYAARLVLSNAGTSSCAGCAGPACLVLNSIRVLRPPRPVGSGDVVLTLPGAGNGNWAGWQTLAAGSCQAVPVRNRTWGQIKSLYR